MKSTHKLERQYESARDNLYRTYDEGSTTAQRVKAYDTFLYASTLYKTKQSQEETKRTK